MMQENAWGLLVHSAQLATPLSQWFKTKHEMASSYTGCTHMVTIHCTVVPVYGDGDQPYRKETCCGFKQEGKATLLKQMT